MPRQDSQYRAMVSDGEGTTGTVGLDGMGHKERQPCACVPALYDGEMAGVLAM